MRYNKRRGGKRRMKRYGSRRNKTYLVQRGGIRL